MKLKENDNVPNSEIFVLENGEPTKKNIEELFGQMVELEQTIFKGSAADVDTLLTKMGPSADLILSVLGSSAGTRLQALIPGDSGTGSLIAAGRGAKVFREAYKEVFASMPNFLKMDLYLALNDPIYANSKQ